MQGFEIYVNDKKYRVRVDYARIGGTSASDYSNRVEMLISVYNEKGEKIKLDKLSYVAEKVGDFIRNSVNGQDTCYWDFDKPNRHLREDKILGKKKYTHRKVGD